MPSDLTLHCPACGHRIHAALGCHGGFLVRAAQLQSGRYGTELSCGACHLSYVVLRIDASQGPAAEEFPVDDYSGSEA